MHPHGHDWIFELNDSSNLIANDLGAVYGRIGTRNAIVLGVRSRRRLKRGDISVPSPGNVQVDVRRRMTQLLIAFPRDYKQSQITEAR